MISGRYDCKYWLCCGDPDIGANPWLKYANFFYSCFDILSPSQNLFILDKNDFQLRCEFEEVDVISFNFKAFNDLTINGALKRE